MSGGGVAGILLILLLVVALFIAASCVKIVPQASAREPWKIQGHLGNRSSF